jgi:hypothetical protein
MRKTFQVFGNIGIVQLESLTATLDQRLKIRAPQQTVWDPAVIETAQSGKITCQHKRSLKFTPDTQCPIADYVGQTIRASGVVETMEQLNIRLARFSTSLSSVQEIPTIIETAIPHENARGF